ncbi:MAG: HlyC/CorC family transporter [Pseudomonadota bacterium]
MDFAATGWDAAMWLTVFAVFALMMLSGFFSGSETALTAASRAKLHTMSEKGAKGADTALRLLEDKESLIGAILLGNNLANILATSLATSLLTAAFGESGVALATLVMTALVVVFAEVMPKTFAITAPETVSNGIARVILQVVRIFGPVVAVISVLVRNILSLFGVKTDPEASVLAAQEEIAGAIALHHSEGAVEKADRDRLLGALDLGQREVDEIMLHRQSIEMIDADWTTDEILSACLKSSYTRLPIFKEDPENIVGVIHAKDLLRAVDRIIRVEGRGIETINDFNVMDVVMEPYFVPETTTLDDQMREFLRRRTHFALVVDEYGALRGLITLEDILEEIVGEIADEHDVEDEVIRQASDGSVVIEGSMTIRDLNRACDWTLPDEEANTVAGLVIHEAQSIPTVGQVFHFHGFRFEVLARERNRVTEIRVRPNP